MIKNGLIMERPKCANPKCNNPAMILLAGKIYCADCVMKLENRKNQFIQEQMEAL